jgi:hypothetical protein
VFISFLIWICDAGDAFIELASATKAITSKIDTSWNAKTIWILLVIPQKKEVAHSLETILRCLECFAGDDEREIFGIERA